MANQSIEFALPGMTVQPNTGGLGGTNYCFSNSWVVTARGEVNDPKLLCFASHNGIIQRIPKLITCEDNRDDDKVFLDRIELRNLLTTLSRM